MTKFLSLLDRAALYFPRVDIIGRADPFEGYYTAANMAWEKLRFDELPQEWRDQTDTRDEETFRRVVQNVRAIRQFVKWSREVTFVSSWHTQPHESAAMWSLYLKTEDGIAVQSTYRRLIDALAGYPDWDIFIGLVRYIDYDREAVPGGNALFPLMYKRKSFEHERELRALIWTPQNNKNGIEPTTNRFRDVEGLHVTVDVNALIEKIFVAPTAPPWVVDLVSSLVKRFGLGQQVVRSRLADSPLY